MVLTQISRSRFKQSLYSSHIHVSTFRAFFCKCFGDFWVYLGINGFPQRINEIYGNRKCRRCGGVLKLEFEVIN